MYRNTYIASMINNQRVNYLLYGQVQSGKTNVLIYTLLYNAFVYGNHQLVILRAYNDDLQQFEHRLMLSVQALTTQFPCDFLTKLIILNIKQVSTLEKDKIYIIYGLCHATLKLTGDLNKMNTFTRMLNDSFNVYVDESDVNAIVTKQSKLQSQLITSILSHDKCRACVYTTATVTAHLLIEQDRFLTKNIICKKTSTKYHSIYDTEFKEIDEFKFSRNNTELTNLSKLKTLIDIIIERRLYSVYDTNTFHRKIVINIQMSMMITHHDELMQYMVRMFPNASIIRHDKGITQMKTDNTLVYHEVGSINQLFKRLGTDTSLYCKSILIIISGKSDGRGVSFNSEETVHCLRITDNVCLHTKSTDMSTLIQSFGRVCGNFHNKHEFTPTIWTLSHNIHDVEKLLKLIDTIIQHCINEPNPCSLQDFYTQENLGIHKGSLPLRLSKLWSATITSNKWTEHNNIYYLGLNPDFMEKSMSPHELHTCIDTLIKWRYHKKAHNYQHFFKMYYDYIHTNNTFDISFDQMHHFLSQSHLKKIPNQVFHIKSSTVYTLHSQLHSTFMDIFSTN